MKWDENVYYHPENQGLEMFGSLEENESYQFGIVAVVRDVAGDLYWASDFGCSCPSPFEDIPFEDWQDVRETWTEFETACYGLRVPEADRVRFIANASAAL